MSSESFSNFFFFCHLMFPSPSHHPIIVTSHICISLLLCHIIFTSPLHIPHHNNHFLSLTVSDYFISTSLLTYTTSLIHHSHTHTTLDHLTFMSPSSLTHHFHSLITSEDHLTSTPLISHITFMTISHCTNSPSHPPDVSLLPSQCRR